MIESRGCYDIAGTPLEYCRYVPERAGGPTLVFLHEGLGCVAMWKEFPQRVAAATGCPVLVYSRAGYGGSGPARLPRPTGFMHLEAREVLPRLLDRAGVERAVLVGHSDGASIALVHAGSDRSGRLAGLALLAPHVFVEKLTVESIDAARAGYATSGLRERLARYHGARVDETFLGWSEVWLSADFRSWNIEAYLPNIVVPTLLIQGVGDNYGTLRQLDAIEAGLPAPTRRLVLDGCGHSPHRDRPEETLQAITGFVAQECRHEL